MEVRFLGTGEPLGMPVIACNCRFCKAAQRDKKKQRLRPSVLVSEGGTNLLLDCSPDFRIQVLENRIDGLNAIFLAHCHFDHLFGLFDLFMLNYIEKVKLPVYVSKNALAFIRKNHPWINLNFVTFRNKEKIWFGSLSITPVKVEHTGLTDTYGFVVESKPNSKKMVYFPDFKAISKKDPVVFMGSDLSIFDGQYITGKYIEDSDHLGDKELLGAINSTNPSKVYLMAISEHWMKKSEKEILSGLPKNFRIPKDRQVVKL